MLIQQGVLQVWGVFPPYCSESELRGLKPGSRLHQSSREAWKCFSPGIQKHLLPAQRGGVKDLLPPTCWTGTLWSPAIFALFLHQPRDVTRPAASWPLSLLCLPQQQVKPLCQLSHTKLPVNRVMLQGTFPVICPKEIYAKCSANLSRRCVCCICLQASKRSGCIWMMLLQNQHHKDRWVEPAGTV